MNTAPLRRLLITGALCASVTGLTACGSSELATDIEPSRTPSLTAPTGDGLAAGAGDQAGAISDLPTTTTGPTPPADTTADAPSADTSDDTSTDTGAATSPSDTETTTSTPSAATGSGGTGGTATPSTGGTNSGTTTSSGGGSGSGTTTPSGSGSGSGSGGGATPSEFGEFCDTNPGVCR